MKENLDYGEVFEKIVQKTSEYLINNNIKAQILGISGGIDSTVCAAICHEVSKRTNIPLIGRSLPTAFNKKDEINSADLVGKAFCDDYKEVNIQNWYTEISDQLFCTEKTPRKIICNGNIQARLRMMYLYDLAGNNDGIVIDTDNLTENNLGYFTIHGDVGDFNPIGGLWKTEVFKLAVTIYLMYTKNNDYTYLTKAEAMQASLQLKPTAGLGITNNDLEEIGAESYKQVDDILQEILAWKWLSNKRGDTFGPTWTMRDAFLEEQQMLDIPINVIIAVTDRHFNSEFKRKQLPIKINREEII
jgi:NAD+ synthetase